MSMQRLPKYRCHKPSGLALVVLNGKAIYLGKYGSTESRAEYDRLTAEWLANGRTIQPGSDYTVAELVRDYQTHVDAYYLKDGQPTSEVRHTETTMRPLRKLYGHTLAKDFRPLALQAVRDMFIKDKLARKTVNDRVRRIIRMFRWAVAGERIPGEVLYALQAVKPLLAGRTEAPDNPPVGPVPQAFVDMVKPLLTPPVRAIVELMEFTAARCGEICQMRTCDIDVSGDVWIYRPTSHKTQHHGKRREIYLGPQAQEVVKPWLRVNISEPLFSPREQMERIRQRMRTGDKDMGGRSRDRRKANPKHRPGEVYSTGTVRIAIRTACKTLDIPLWHPHQLRHNAGTYIAAQFGIEIARIILGHSNLKTTELYAEMNRSAAAKVIGRIG